MSKNTLNNQIENIIEDSKKRCKRILNDAVIELFKKCGPKLKYVNITGCHEFNDGEATYFSSNKDEPNINGYASYDEDDEEEDNLYYQAENGNEEAKKIVEAVTDLTSQFDDSVLEFLYSSEISLNLEEDGIKE